MKILFHNMNSNNTEFPYTVKKSKTTALDRLEKTIISFKASAKGAAGKKSECVSRNNKGRKEPSTRSDNPEPTRQKSVATSKKKCEAVISSIIEQIESKTESTADIPTIFGLKTPAQNRLTKLRKKLEADINSEMLDVEQRNDETLHVIRNGFGIKTQSDVVDAGNTITSTIQHEENMEMDWEPSFTEDANQTEFSLNFIEDIVFKDLSESAYIVPDTNIFLDSLDCIRSIIQKGVNNIYLIILVAQFIWLTAS